MLQKIAFLGRETELDSVEFAHIKHFLGTQNIQAAFFDRSEDIEDFKPDCVIALTPQDAKLTRYPTYGFITQVRDWYLTVPRLTRNVLSYDGYLTCSETHREWLEDVMFGARKLNTQIVPYDHLPPMGTYRSPDLSS